MKNIKDLGEKTAIQCKTQEEWDYLVENYDISCVRSRPDLKVHLLDPNSGTYTLDYAARNGYTIVQASDFMPLSPQDEIKELKARIATLEESLRPKKKIEFVKFINVGLDPFLEDVKRHPNSFAFIERIVCATRDNELDILECWDGDRSLSCIYLGHFNDGEK